MIERRRAYRLIGFGGVNHPEEEGVVETGGGAGGDLVSSFGSPRISINSSSKTADVATLVMSVPIPLQEALKDSITSGSFVDTKFWLFSKHDHDAGRVGGPKAVFVNGCVAKRIPRLGVRTTTLCCHSGSQANPLTVLDECKNKENLRTRFPANRKPHTSNYDYEDDSDLEEDDEEDVSDDESAVPPRVATKKSRNHPPERDSFFSEPPDTKGDVEPVHVGKVVVIEDVAFVT